MLTTDMTSQYPSIKITAHAQNQPDRPAMGATRRTAAIKADVLCSSQRERRKWAPSAKIAARAVAGTIHHEKKCSSER
jgi:hypothetical protein